MQEKIPGFAGRLKELIEGEKQQEVAAKLGVGQSAMSRWLHGTRCPTPVQIAAIAKAYGVTTDWLLGLQEAPGDWEKSVEWGAVMVYGVTHQTVKAMEELGELTQALAKGVCEGPDHAHIAEEIADVEIMLEQLKVCYPCAEQVRGIRRFKLERLEKTLLEEMEAGDAADE